MTATLVCLAEMKREMSPASKHGSLRVAIACLVEIITLARKSTQLVTAGVGTSR